MSSRQGVFGPRLVILFGMVVFAGIGCRTCLKVPCYYADASVKKACEGKQPGNHDIEVNEKGEVSVSDTCVAISHKEGHSVRWLAKSRGEIVSIAFVLIKNQPEPFQHMACGVPDKNGNKICVLVDCPEDCKTTFRPGYNPSTTESSLNYYYYSPGVTMFTRGTSKAGSDPGIRIDP